MEEQNNPNPMKGIFEGKQGTILFWVIVVIGAIFFLKLLPKLISIAFSIALFAGIVYLLYKVFGKKS